MLPTEVTTSTIINAREKLRLLVAIRDSLDKVVHDARLNLMRVEDQYYAGQKTQGETVMDRPSPRL